MHLAVHGATAQAKLTAAVVAARFAKVVESVTSDLAGTEQTLKPTGIEGSGHAAPRRTPDADGKRVGRVIIAEPFGFSRAGLSPAAARPVTAVDSGRVAIVAGMGLEPTTVLDRLHLVYSGQGVTADDIGELLKSFPPFAHRYLSDDAAFGSVSLEEIGKRRAVATPAIGAVVTAVGVLAGPDPGRYAADIASPLPAAEVPTRGTGQRKSPTRKGIPMTDLAAPADSAPLRPARPWKRSITAGPDLDGTRITPGPGDGYAIPAPTPGGVRCAEKAPAFSSWRYRPTANPAGTVTSSTTHEERAATAEVERVITRRPRRTQRVLSARLNRT